MRLNERAKADAEQFLKDNIKEMCIFELDGMLGIIHGFGELAGAPSDSADDLKQYVVSNGPASCAFSYYPFEDEALDGLERSVFTLILKSVRESNPELADLADSLAKRKGWL